MHIRSVRPEDNFAIENLADAIWGNDAIAEAKRPKGWSRRKFTSETHQISPKDGESRTLIAEHEGKLLGAATAQEIDTLPSQRLMISVLPEYRRQGIGSSLLNAIVQRDKIIYHAREWLDDGSTVPFYKQLGFEEIERVTEGWVYPDRKETATWFEQKLQQSAKTVEVLEADDSRSTATRFEIARLMEQAMVESLKHLNMSIRSDEEAAEFFFGTALPKTLFVAYIDDRLQAAATLSEPLFGFDKTAAHLIWIYTRDDSADFAYELTEALMCHCFMRAAELGLRVQLDVNNLKPHPRQCAHSIPSTDLVEDMCILSSGKL